MTKCRQTQWLVSSSDNPKSAIQNPKWRGLVAFILAFVLCGAVAQAQQAVKINLAISTMGLQMMGLRDALQMDETLSIPAHMMLREEFRRPLDEVRAKEGTKAYLQKRDGPFQPEPFGPRAKKKP